MRIRSPFRVLSVVSGLGLFGWGEARACSVCYGAAESPVLDGLNLSILLMLGVTYLVIGGFIVFFIHLMRRERVFNHGLKEVEGVPHREDLAAVVVDVDRKSDRSSGRHRRSEV